MITYNTQKAAGKLTTLVFGTIVIIFLYSAYHILPFYYYYYELQNHFESHAKVANENTTIQLRNKLMYHINKMGIPMDKPEDLIIDKRSDKIIISLAYTEIFYVPYNGKEYVIHNFDFLVHAEEPLK